MALRPGGVADDRSGWRDRPIRHSSTDRQCRRAATRALAGMGIVMLPEIMVSEEIAAGRLGRLLLGYAPPIRPITLLYLRDRRMSPKLRSFVDFVVDRFSTQS